MGWFNFLEPETFVFYVRCNRFFGPIPDRIHVPTDKPTDAEVVGKYHECVERYLIADRHSHLSREHSIDLWIKQIKDDLLKEFRGNLSMNVCLSDEECYAQHMEKAVEFDCMLEARCK